MASRNRIPPGIADMANALLRGDRSALARAITLAESMREGDQKQSSLLLKQLLPNTGKSLRIGITGTPGVGKSTFIEAFGEMLAGEERKIAVLTVDPTSQKTKGSILGDKTRMERLSRNPNVFIRPSPTGLALGGVTFHTREAILLCEAAGFDTIFIETVGVGQSETIVRGMVDFFLLLVLAGAGDELQGIKKGIMEMADGIVVTKADGDNVKAAKQAQTDAMQALHFQQSAESGWKTKVLTVSSRDNTGLQEVWKLIRSYQQHADSTGYFAKNRKHQQQLWLDECLEDHFRRLVNEPGVTKKKVQLLKGIMKGTILPGDAARELWGIVKRK